jgi:AcrR family transcriptional regulator
MSRRADSVEETRRRIVEAAVALHGTAGPARTTISAVAEQAGVGRLTVYRHFADDHELFRACTSHWLALNPFPDPTAWSAIADPETRLRRALTELYSWYRETGAMMGNFVRDAPLVPALRERLEEWEAYLDAARRALAPGLGAGRRSTTLQLAALAHALDFHAWASLARHGLDDAAAADLMSRLVLAARS